MALTSPGKSLVDRTVIEALLGRLPVGGRLQPEHRHVRIQLLGTRLGQKEVIPIPAGALYKQAMDVTAVRRRFLDLLLTFLHHLQAPHPMKKHFICYLFSIL